jgi:hypothetical protein
MSRRPAPIVAHMRSMQSPHGIDIVAKEGKLRRIVQDENRLRRIGSSTVARGAKMAAQNLALIDLGVVEKAIRGFRTGPILTRQRNALPRVRRKPLKQHAKALREPLITESTPIGIFIDPRSRRPHYADSDPSALLHILVRHAAP